MGSGPSSPKRCAPQIAMAGSLGITRWWGVTHVRPTHTRGAPRLCVRHARWLQPSLMEKLSTGNFCWQKLVSAKSGASEGSGVTGDAVKK